MAVKIKNAVIYSLFFIICVSVILAGLADSVIKSSVSAFDDEELSLPAYTELEYKETENKTEHGFSVTETDAVLKVAGIPIKKVNVSVYKNLEVILGGQNFGILLKTNGVQIVGVENGENESPAKAAGLKEKDLIISANGKKLTSSKEFVDLVAESKGEVIKLEYKRDGKIYNTSLYASPDSAGIYKAGVWVKDTVAGIGTMTYMLPDDGAFAGLGHGICDEETGELIPFISGEVYDAHITGVKQGKLGEPGELRGFFGKEPIGKMSSNSETGVYGTLDQMIENKKVNIALKSSVKEGPAKIICTIDSKGAKEYDAEVVKIINYEYDTKNFIIKITDKDLLNKTGGIVQGMSGSPVLQDGKLIGAVTHVLVNDPAKGYGIFIENMLKNAD